MNLKTLVIRGGLLAAATLAGPSVSWSGGSCCSVVPTSSTERGSIGAERVEQLLKRKDGRAALVAAAMGNSGFMADYMDAIAQDRNLRSHAARLVREAPDGGSSHKSQGQGLVYSCPMHPEVTSDRPGKCPKCGMALDRGAARASSRGVDPKLARAAERAVREERHRNDVIDVLLADQAFTKAWIMAAGVDQRWREEALQIWTGKSVGSRPEEQDRSVRNAAHYTCPMHPEVDSDQPGSCPKCGMDLVRRTG